MSSEAMIHEIARKNRAAAWWEGCARMMLGACGWKKIPPLVSQYLPADASVKNVSIEKFQGIALRCAREAKFEPGVVSSLVELLETMAADVEAGLSSGRIKVAPPPQAEPKPGVQPFRATTFVPGTAASSRAAAERPTVVPVSPSSVPNRPEVRAEPVRTVPVVPARPSAEFPEGEPVPRNAKEFALASAEVIQVLLEMDPDNKVLPIAHVTRTLWLTDRPSGKATSVLGLGLKAMRDVKGIVPAMLSMVNSGESPESGNDRGAQGRLPRERKVPWNTAVFGMSASAFHDALRQAGFAPAALPAKDKGTLAWISLLWSSAKEQVEYGRAVDATLFLLGLYLEPWLAEIADKQKRTANKPADPLGALCDEWGEEPECESGLWFVVDADDDIVSISFEPSDADDDNADDDADDDDDDGDDEDEDEDEDADDDGEGDEDAEYESIDVAKSPRDEAFDAILPWSVATDGLPVWLTAYDGVRVWTVGDGDDVSGGVLFCGHGPRLAVVVSDGKEEHFDVEVWWTRDDNDKPALRQYPSAVGTGHEPFRTFRHGNDWYAGAVPKVLREVAALCPDDPVDTAARTRILDALCRLGPWLETVVARPFVHRDRGVPTLQLAFIKGPQPRLQVVLAHWFESLGETWTPEQGKGIEWRWVDGAAHFHVRDIEAERESLDDLSKALGIGVMGPMWRREIAGHQDIVTFLNLDFKTMRVEWVVDSERPASFGARGMRVSVSNVSSMLHVSGSYDHLGRNVPLEELLAEIRHGRRFAYSKTAGTWFEIAPEIAEALRTLALGMGEDRKGKATLTPWAVPAVSELGAYAAEVTLPDELPRFVPTDKRLAEALAMNVELPRGLRDVTLRPYQQQGFEWLVRTAHWSPGALLGDDMGLGKSLQALCVAAVRAGDGPTLVVAPKSLSGNWAKEAGKFLPRVFRVRPVLDGTAEGAILAHGARAGDLVITTWNRVQRNPEAFQTAAWATVILDEIHGVRNAATATYKAIEAVARQARARGGYVMGLSGTPVQNNVKELEAVFELLVPGYLSGVDAVRKQEGGGEANAQAVLRAAIRPFFLRRRKEDVAKDLPDRIETRVPIALSENERTFYEEIRRAAWDSLKKHGGAGEGAHIFEALARLRQLCLDWRLVGKSGVGSKTEVVIDHVTELVAEGRPCLVFSQFTGYLDVLEMAFFEQKTKTLRIDGKTPQKAREEAVRAFQAGETSVFLLGLKSGGEGLNLTRASDVLLVDPWWNRAAERQAMDRAHRLGQTRTVNVWRFIAEDTIEEHIVSMANNKQAMVDDLIEGRDTGKALDLDELRRMLAFGARTEE